MWRSIWKLAAIALGCALAATAAQYENPAWSPDGKSIALTSVENRASRIVVMDSGGSNSKPVTPIEQRSRWSAWSPDGKRIAYFVQGPVNEIWQVNVDTLARAKLSDFGLGTTTLDWSAVRNEIALTRGTGKETGIDILNLETHQIRRVLFADQASQPRWSPDGTQILFSTVTGLAVLDLSSSTVHALLH